MLTNPLLFSECTRELELIRAEVDVMVIGLEGRRPKGVVRDRALHLRSRFEAIKITLRSFETQQMAREVAFHERTGEVFDEDKHEFTQQDEARAAEILQVFGLQPGVE